MAMTVGGKKGGPMGDINITPLIDVLLVLIIIFMVIVPHTPHGLGALIPQPNKNKKQNQAVLERTIVVSINAQRQVKINETPVPLDQLQTRLVEIFKTRNDRVMFVSGDPSLPFAAVVPVIDSAHGADIDKVGLILKQLQTQ
ncbi:MAG: ExbD/TolR family protein [Terriglobia bacterium]